MMEESSHQHCSFAQYTEADVPLPGNLLRTVQSVQRMPRRVPSSVLGVGSRTTKCKDLTVSVSCLRAGELSSIRQLSTVRLHCHSVIPGTHCIRRQAPCAPPSRPRAFTTQENATPLLKQEWLPTKSPPQCTSSLSELRAARSGGRYNGCCACGCSAP